MEVIGQTITSAVVPPYVPFGERRMSKREKNRIRCLRRRQRRRERWRQSQLQESRQSHRGNLFFLRGEFQHSYAELGARECPHTCLGPLTSGNSGIGWSPKREGLPSQVWPEKGAPRSSTGNLSSSSSSEDDDVSADEKEGYICAVCLDVYFSPYMCQPCDHIFCEPCLRTLAKNCPTNTPCPLCRTIITHVFFQKELNQTARTFFPKEYLSRKQNFQKASCAKWPLPSCRKLFRIFGGFQRQSSPIARRQFPHGGGYRLDDLDFEDVSRGWRFDMDMVIIYIYSVNWVIGFFIFCFLCYLFFPSF
ncbi:E3 ubiquitin-protein ligase RNF180 [Anarhichas minor]|uniref:E3 ubiquitin-protein ligase RNF180 n=1 Tax=Anarhichas minor TaxID=65739 RepID=UPI003F741581